MPRDLIKTAAGIVSELPLTPSIVLDPFERSNYLAPGQAELDELHARPGEGWR
jgi:hypothetical protein